MQILNKYWPPTSSHKYHRKFPLPDITGCCFTLPVSNETIYTWLLSGFNSWTDGLLSLFSPFQINKDVNHSCQTWTSPPFQPTRLSDPPNKLRLGLNLDGEKCIPWISFPLSRFQWQAGSGLSVIKCSLPRMDWPAVGGSGRCHCMTEILYKESGMDKQHVAQQNIPCYFLSSLAVLGRPAKPHSLTSATLFSFKWSLV